MSVYMDVCVCVRASVHVQVSTGVRAQVTTNIGTRCGASWPSPPAFHFVGGVWRGGKSDPLKRWGLGGEEGMVVMVVVVCSVMVMVVMVMCACVVMTVRGRARTKSKLREGQEGERRCKGDKH